jgi:hypothetical protein
MGFEASTRVADGDSLDTSNVDRGGRGGLVDGHGARLSYRLQ